MQKFGALTKWFDLKDDQTITFQHSMAVKIEVSTPQDTEWYYEELAGTKTFLATTSGRDVLEFTPSAGSYLRPSKGVKYKSAQNSIMHVEHSGAESFTEPYVPAERHPELERIAQAAATRAVQRDRAAQAEIRRRETRHAQLKEAQHNARTGQAQPAAKADGNTDAPAPGTQSDNPTDPAGQDQGTAPVGVSDNGEGAGGELPNSDAATDK